jgi:putative flippase GtrA
VKRRLARVWAEPGTRRFTRFIAVGVLNTIFGYAMYAVMIFSGLPPQPALAFSFFLGVIWNFFTHGRLVFGTRGYRRLPHYGAAYLFIYFCNAIALEALLRAGIQPLVAQMIVLPFVVIASFLLVGRALTGRWPIGRNEPS